MFTMLHLDVFFVFTFCLSVWRFQITSGNPVKGTSCSLDKVENSLATAIRIIKFLREDPNFGEDSIVDKPTTHEQITVTEEGGIGTTVTSVELIETNSTATCKLRPVNCADIQILGNIKSGVYEIYPKWQPKAKGYKVYCDMNTEGGGWTVVQRRLSQDIQEQFNRTWAEYKIGFGNLKNEFWIGNTHLNLLTTQDQMMLRLEMEDWDGMKRYSHYKGFVVFDEEQGYRMTYTQYYDSTVGGDDLTPSKDAPFVTIDKDNTNKLAATFYSGFWWTNVAQVKIYANPNGIFYPKGKHLSVKNGIFLAHFKGVTYSLKRIEMKLRPLYYTTEEYLPRAVNLRS